MIIQGHLLMQVVKPANSLRTMRSLKGSYSPLNLKYLYSPAVYVYQQVVGKVVSPRLCGGSSAVLKGP